MPNIDGRSYFFVYTHTFHTYTHMIAVFPYFCKSGNHRNMEIQKLKFYICWQACMHACAYGWMQMGMEETLPQPPVAP